MYVAKGNSFLADYLLYELEKSYSQESNGKAKIRLQCAVLRKKGKSIPFISEVVGKAQSTVSDILHRFEQRGIIGCYAIRQKGQPQKLRRKERIKLMKVVKNHRSQTG